MSVSDGQCVPGGLEHPQEQSRSGWLVAGAVALAILALGAAVTAAFALSMDRAAHTLTSSMLEARASRAEHAIADRLMACEAVLRAGAGFIDNAWPITEAQWRRFARPLNLGEALSGVQGFGFAAVVSKLSSAHLAVLPAALWSNPAAREEHPQTAIVLLEPQDVRNKQALGFDMSSEPVRRAAMERARDERTAAVSGRVTLVQEIDSEPQPGFLMYVPVYERDLPTDTIEERRAALIGRWQQEASAAFLSAYRAVAAEAPDPWVPAEAEAALLDLFLVEKAAYEIRYEAANRPTWIGVPLRGLAALADRLVP